MSEANNEREQHNEFTTDEVDWSGLFVERLNHDPCDVYDEGTLESAVRAHVDDDDRLPDEIITRAVDEGLLDRVDDGTVTPTPCVVGDPGHAVGDGETAQRNGEKTADGVGSSDEDTDADGELPEKYVGVPERTREKDNWLTWDSSSDRKQPHRKGDFHISWSDPDDWMSFEEAARYAEGRPAAGIGRVNALDNDGVPDDESAAFDLDGCLVEERGDTKDWVPDLDTFTDAGVYVEYSPSGMGLRIPCDGYEPPEWFTNELLDDEHEGVEVLTNKFSTITGDALDDAGARALTPEVLDPDKVDEWLLEAYRNLTGEDPPGYGDEGDESTETPDSVEGDEVETGEYHGDGLAEEQARDALDHINPDVSYPTWRDIGFALVDEFDGKTALDLFRDWSRGGSKWDKDAQKQAKKIISDASPGGGVTGGTLVHHARQNGWEPPKESGDGSDAVPTFDIDGGGQLILEPIDGSDCRVRVKDGDGETYTEVVEKGAWETRGTRENIASAAADTVDLEAEAVRGAFVDALAEEEADPDRWTKLMRDETTAGLLDRTEEVVVYPAGDETKWVVRMRAGPEDRVEGAETFEFGAGEFNNSSPSAFCQAYLSRFLTEVDLDGAAWDELTTKWIDAAEVKETETDVARDVLVEDLLRDLGTAGAFDVVHEDDKTELFDPTTRRAVFVENEEDPDEVMVPARYVTEKVEDAGADITNAQLSQELRDRGIMTRSTTQIRDATGGRSSVWAFDADQTGWDRGGPFYRPAEDEEEEVVDL